DPEEPRVQRVVLRLFHVLEASRGGGQAADRHPREGRAQRHLHHHLGRGRPGGIIARAGGAARARGRQRWRPVTTSLPLSLTRMVTIQLTMLTTSAPRTAAQKPATWKPLTSAATIQRQSPLRTSRNRPRVSSVIGSVRTSKMGRTTALTRPRRSPAATAE